MAKYQRRRRYTRRSIRRRPYGRRYRRYGRRSIRRGRRSYASRIYAFKRRVTFAPITSNATLDSLIVYTPKLGDVPNYNEFVTLFDAFKITGVKLSFYPRTDQNPNNEADIPGGCGLIYHTVDYDDTIALDVEQIQQYQTCRTTKGDKPFNVFFRPRNRVPVYFTDQIDNSFGSSQGTPWIDAANPGTCYYGYKLAWTATPGATFAYDVTGTYYIKCKDVR